MRSVKQKAYAKINLSLDILGRLENGYHIVKMVMQTIDLSDELIFETQDRECPSMEITLVTDNGEIPGGEDNLIVRAVRRMEYKYGIRRDLRITLKKNIPVAAGMAGGSTDAAAALRAVRDLFVPDVSDEELQKIGVTLGADIPYCVTGGTQLSEGIGEVLTVLPDAPQCGLVICKPPVGVSTGEVYKRYDSLEDVRHPDIDAQIEAIRRGDLAGMAGECGNVLEEVTGAMYPRIGEIERFFEKEGALVSKMSGSGPTVFAVFADKQEAARAAQAFEAADEGKGCRIIVCDFVYRIMEDADGRQ
jgi:4-diphosphocytidyl-2-C-methyl-D-erythritol kinase